MKEPKKVGSTKNNIKIIKCNCENNYQDQRYGSSMRVHNSCNKGYRCTTCSKEK